MALLSTRSKSSITDDVATTDSNSSAAMKVLRLKPSGMATAHPLPLLGLGKSTAQDPSPPFLSSDGKMSATSATMDSTLNLNGKRIRTITWVDEVTCEALEVNNDKRSKIANVSSRGGETNTPSSSNTVGFPTTNDNNNNSNNSNNSNNNNNNSDEENILTPSDNDPNKSSGRTLPIKSALRNNNSMNKALLPNAAAAAAAVATTIRSSSSINSSKKKKAVPSTNESEVESSTRTKKHSKRQHWTESEDNQLRQVVSEFTHTNQRTSYARSFTTANAGSNSRTKSATNSIEWVKIAEKMGGDRSGKQCRERYLNHLQPGLNTSEFTPEEDALIERLVLRMGTKWTDISQLVPGRTDASVKNRWNKLQRQSSSKRKARKENKNENPSMNPSPAVQVGDVQARRPSYTPIVHPMKAGGDEKVPITENTNSLAHLFDPSLAKEVEEDIARSSMIEDRANASPEGTVSSESPKVGQRVRVRFEDDDGESTYFEGTITAVYNLSKDSSISSELLDMAMDIDRLANAVAAAAANPSHHVAARSGENMNSATSQTTRIEIKYDDGTIEKNVPIGDDTDIQILPSDLSGEEMPPNAGVSSLHNPDCVPLDTVRGLLLGKCDPIQLAMSLLTSDEVALVKQKWTKSDSSRV